jgi:hypothetical protein
VERRRQRQMCIRDRVQTQLEESMGVKDQFQKMHLKSDPSLPLLVSQSQWATSLEMGQWKSRLKDLVLVQKN